jgi:hypothetical protein
MQVIMQCMATAPCVFSRGRTAVRSSVLTEALSSLGTRTSLYCSPLILIARVRPRADGMTTDSTPPAAASAGSE